MNGTNHSNMIRFVDDSIDKFKKFCSSFHKDATAFQTDTTNASKESSKIVGSILVLVTPQQLKFYSWGTHFETIVHDRSNDWGENPTARIFCSNFQFNLLNMLVVLTTNLPVLSNHLQVKLGVHTYKVDMDNAALLCKFPSVSFEAHLIMTDRMPKCELTFSWRHALNVT